MPRYCSGFFFKCMGRMYRCRRRSWRPAISHMASSPSAWRSDSWAHMRRPLAVAALCPFLWIGVACAGGTVSDGTGPITPVDTTKPPVGTVPRGTITVRVSIDPADAAIASAAGVNTAGLAVRLMRQLSSDAASRP